MAEVTAGRISAELCATLNATATAWFTQQLAESSEAQRLFRERGVTEAVMAEYRLGFAPDTNEGLYRHLSKAGYSDRVLIDAGLARDSERGVYDAFRSKLIFPVIDIDGERVLGFQSRQLGDELPKYVNSPKTVLFDKSRILYGMPQLAEIARSGEALVVEGNFDLLSLLSHGVRNVVAALGTALTADHIFLLSEYTTHITLIFDADAAGQKATQTTLLLPGAAEFDMGVVHLAGGKDPDEILRDAPDSWPTLIAARMTRWEALWHTVRDAYPEQLGLEDKLAIQRAWFPLVAANAPNEIAMTEIERGAQAIGVDVSIVKDEYLTGRASSTHIAAVDELALAAISLNWESLKPMLEYVALEGAAAEELARWRRVGTADATASVRHLARNRADQAMVVWRSLWAARVRPAIIARMITLSKSIAAAPLNERARLEAEVAMLSGWLGRPVGL